MNPTRVAWYGICVYLFIYLIAPVNVVTPQSLEPYLYILCGFLCFFLGCQVVERMDHRELAKMVPERDPIHRLERIHYWVTLASVLGVILRTTDRLFIRGVSFSGSVLERQADMGAVGSNPVSIASALFLPATMIVPLTYMLLARAGKGSRRGNILMHFLFAFPILEAATVAGQRSIGIAYLVMYLLYSIYLRRFTIRPKHIMLVSVIAVVALTGATYVFNNRLAAMNLSPLNSVYTSGYAFTVQPKPWAGDFIRQHTGPLGDAAFAVMLTCQYYVHGLFEFVNLYRQAPDVHLWGAISFNAYYKLFAYIANLPDPLALYISVTPHIGVYLTFFGAVFSDFGWYGMIYMLAFGIAVASAWKVCLRGDIAMVPLYMYTVIIVFCLPVTNFIVGSEGLFRINCFLIFFLVFRRKVQPRKQLRAVVRGVRPLRPGWANQPPAKPGDALP